MQQKAEKITASICVKMRPNVDIVFFLEKKNNGFCDFNEEFQYTLTDILCLSWFFFTFCSPITNSNQPKIQMASSKGVGEPLQCIRFLSNVSYDIEYVCFKKIPKIFWTCQLFLLGLSTFGLLIVTSQRWKLIFVSDNHFLGFCTTSFHTKICDICA